MPDYGYNAGKNYGQAALTRQGVSPLTVRQKNGDAAKEVIRNLLRGVNQIGPAQIADPGQAQLMRQWGYHNVHQALVQAGYNAQDAANLMAEAMHLSPEKAGYGQGAGAPGTYGQHAKDYQGPERAALGGQPAPAPEPSAPEPSPLPSPLAVPPGGVPVHPPMDIPLPGGPLGPIGPTAPPQQLSSEPTAPQQQPSRRLGDTPFGRYILEGDPFPTGAPSPLRFATVRPPVSGTVNGLVGSGGASAPPRMAGAVYGLNSYGNSPDPRWSLVRSGTIQGLQGAAAPPDPPRMSGTVNGVVDRPGPSPAALGPAGTRTAPSSGPQVAVSPVDESNTYGWSDTALDGALRLLPSPYVGMPRWMVDLPYRFWGGEYLPGVTRPSTTLPFDPISLASWVSGDTGGPPPSPGYSIEIR